MSRIIPVPAVNAIVFNEQREILLTRRSAQIREPGKWCLPGGHLEAGEDLVTAIRREVQEEVGLVVRKEELMGIYSDPALTVTTEILPEGHRAQFVVAAFVVREYEGDVTPNFEVDKWGWFRADNLPEPMLKSHPIRVADAFAFRGEVFVR